MPRVSVLMSVYNGECYLRDAVDSILSQTFTDFEFIIVDDGSTDGTVQILDSYSDPRIVRINNEKNLGLAASLNIGIDRAQGEYIARMDADDVSLPTRLLEQIRYLEKVNTVGVLGTPVVFIDEDGVRIAESEQPPDHNRSVWTLIFGNPFIHPTIMARRILLTQVGGYRLNGPAQDRELWIRLIRNTRYANLCDPLLLYRLHPNSVTSLRRKARRGEIYSPYPEPDQLLRKRLIEDLLGREVSPETIEWLTVSQGVQNALNSGLEDYQIETTILLMLEIFDAFVAQSIFLGDTTEVKSDLIRRIVAVSRYSPQCVMPGKLAKTWRRPLQRRALLAVREIAKAVRVWPSHWN